MNIVVKYDKGVNVPQCVKKTITNNEAHITDFKIIALLVWSTNKDEQEKGVDIYQLTGENPTQEFVSYYDMKGKPLGGLLKLKNEAFWQVWDENSQVVTTPMEPCEENNYRHVSRTVGSQSKEEADGILEERIRRLIL